MRRLRALKVPMLLAVTLAGCEMFPSEPSSRPCGRVAVTRDSTTFAVRDPDTGVTVAVFRLAYRESHWVGNLDRLMTNQYNRLNYVVLTIRNEAAATISFEYLISHPHYRYAGDVTRLAPGRSMEYEICFMFCYGSTSSAVVSTGPISYTP